MLVRDETVVRRDQWHIHWFLENIKYGLSMHLRPSRVSRSAGRVPPASPISLSTPPTEGSRGGVPRKSEGEALVPRPTGRGAWLFASRARAWVQDFRGCARTWSIGGAAMSHRAMRGSGPGAVVCLSSPVPSSSPGDACRPRVCPPMDRASERTWGRGQHDREPISGACDLIERCRHCVTPCPGS